MTWGDTIGLRNKQGKPLHNRLPFQQHSPDETCTNKDCPIIDQSICCITGCVYIVIYLFCKQYYIGSTTRPSHQRASEHLRAAKKPASYKGNAPTEHYETTQSTCHEPSLKFALLGSEKERLILRHTETLMIDERQPKRNQKFKEAFIGLLIGNYTHTDIEY